jgi:hypothetical protein
MDSFAAVLKYLRSNMCEEANFVLISNNHNSHEYMCVTDPICFIRRLKNQRPMWAYAIVLIIGTIANSRISCQAQIS